MTKYLDSAPKYLVELHRNREIGPGHNLLGKLLTEPTMSNAWVNLGKRVRTDRVNLGKRVRTDREWRNLFQEIIYALKKSRRNTPPRSILKERYESVAGKADALRKAIENGPLDLMAYEYFPFEVLAILGVEESWSTMDGPGRAHRAGQLLNCWPSFIEMLDAFRVRAKALADQAMTEPRVIERHVVEAKQNRTKASEQVTFFARSMESYFRRTYERPFLPVIADLASIALNIPDLDIKVIQRAVR